MNYLTEHELSFAESFKLPQPIYVDVRSESEFALDHIPGALNLPVLNDEERCQTGTIYKQVSPKEARQIGLTIVAPKLPQLVSKIAKLAEQGQVVLYCWRGGLRSSSLSMVLDIMRVPHYRLQHGYKDFRTEVNQYFTEPLPFNCYVLNGLTGIGKTHVLHHLTAAGAQAVDLEGLGGHRGSAFGNVGLPVQPSQKLFESRLWYVLQGFNHTKPIFVECESKRIGRLLVPESFFDSMKAGRRLLLYDTVASRVTRILEDYRPQEQAAEIERACRSLAPRLGSKCLEKILAAIAIGDYATVVEILLRSYYDPLYCYPDEPSEQFEACFCSTDCGLAAAEILRYCNHK